MMYLWVLNLAQNVDWLDPTTSNVLATYATYAASMLTVITAFVGEDVTNIVRIIRG